MILNISFKNYRSFKDKTDFSLIAEPSKIKSDNISNITIGKGDNIRLLRVAALFGANASGKSTLLRGVYEMAKLIVNKSTVGNQLKAYDPFAFFEETRNNPVEFSIDFVIDNVKYSYFLKFDVKNILEETLISFPNNKSTVLFKRELPSNIKKNITHKGIIGNPSKRKNIEVFHNQTILSKFGSDIPDEIISIVFLYFKEIIVVNSVNQRMLSSFDIKLREQCDKNQTFFAKINEIIKFVDTGINALSLSKENEDDFKFPDDFPNDLKTKIVEDNKNKLISFHNFFKNEKLLRDNEPFPFEEESHGTKKLFTLSGILLRAIEKGQPIFIDELETSLHPFLTKTLIALFQNSRINNNNAQLIFTTQDTNLLDRYLLRKDQIWLTEKDKYGNTDLFSLQDFSDVREDTSFEKWYLSGKFGALPKIKSLENLFID